MERIAAEKENEANHLRRGAPSKRSPAGELLIFNLKTDSEDAVLGFTTAWINALAAGFAKVHVITMCAGRVAVAPNVEVHSVGKEKGYSEARRAFEFFRLLARVLRGGRVRACFAHMMPLFAVMGWPMLRMRGIPIVMWYAHKSVTPTLRLATALVDRVVASSRSGFRVETPKLRIIGQGIDTERFRAKPGRGRSQPFRLLTVGRVSAIKRLDILVEAMALLRKRMPSLNLDLTVIGGPLTASDREYQDGLAERIVAAGLTDRVHLLGSRPFHEVHGYYGEADLFVSASDTGSADKTLLEAMSCGLPMVTSNSSMQEILGPELSGRLVVAQDDAEAMADRIQGIALAPPEEAGKLGEALRRVVEEGHSLSSLAGKIINEFKELEKVAYEQV